MYKKHKGHQSRVQSLIESSANIVTGLTIAIIVTQIYDFFIDDVNIPVIDNLTLSIILTLISFIRTYLWRRYFNNNER